MLLSFNPSVIISEVNYSYRLDLVPVLAAYVINYGEMLTVNMVWQHGV